MSSPLSVRELRRRWKPHKERLAVEQPNSPTPIRFHRACSWVARVENNANGQDPDLDLISLWIAFNSLYGRWDPQKQEPKPDRQTWRCFVDTLLRLDSEGHLTGLLGAHQDEVLSIIEDEYLSGYFWKEPSAKRAGHSKRAKFSAQSWYVEHRWTMLLDQILERVYLVRCQLVHGAATHSGKLNRTSLQRCVWMMQRLLPAFLQVWIDHGADEDWGPLCYPPLAAISQSHPHNGFPPKQPR